MMRVPSILAPILVVCTLVACRTTPGTDTVVIEDGATTARWAAHPADGVELALAADDGALRLDFRFSAGGYAIARRDVDLDLPGNYAFRFKVRGEAPVNHLEFKLVDDSGENVWWSVHRDVDFPRDWETFVVKKRHLDFAWGPRGGGEIRHVAALEFAITAGEGGEGTVWIDDLELTPLPPVSATPPVPLADASSGGDAASVLDGDPVTSWSPAPDDGDPELRLDLRQPREFGGLIVDWAPEHHAIDYDVAVSDDGAAWRTLQAVRGSNGGRDHLYLPESEARYLRLKVLRTGGDGPPAVTELALKPLAWSETRESFFSALAAEAPRGTYPRGFVDEQSYWTVVGVDGDSREGLLGEDGQLETGPGRFAVEPFLYVDGRLMTWADVAISQELAEGCLPVPTVRWRAGDIELAVTVFATGEPGASSLVARYTLLNHGVGRLPATLFLALRPFQVNPPSQSLNIAGGTAPVRRIERAGREVMIDGERGVTCLTAPDGFGADGFFGGDIVEDHLRRGSLPPGELADDDFAAASGALAYHLDPAPQGRQSVDILCPLHPGAPPIDASGPGADWVDAAREHALDAWRGKLGGFTLELPAVADDVVKTLRAQLGYILVNRAGPAIQPGARSYARSWIRDGALTGWALLRTGLTAEARAFLEWYAPHQYTNGKIPCVVDRRGADPVPEHDSCGEFIFLVSQVYRYDGDAALLERMWPRVRDAADYLDALRQERRTAAYRAPDKLRYYGLLPPSISHEGYAAKPMHSYWDDFFALRGFKDAAWLAGELDLPAEAARLGAIRDEFAADLGASVTAAMTTHGIDFVPGCADLGDFDPTSTTIALSPADAGNILPEDSLAHTFERYWRFFVDRRDGAPWDAYTPYEIRNVGAFVRLGWRERAYELLEFFLADRRPVGWRHWAEVVSRESRVPRFLGDMPHTWVGSDYVRSVLDMFAYDRARDEALVIGAGLPMSWLAGNGVTVGDLPTPYGPLGYAIRRDGNTVVVEIDAGLRVPPGGIVVQSPGVAETTVRALPARLVMEM